MKRLLSLLLCAAMLCCTFPVLAETVPADPWVLSEVTGGWNVDSCTWPEGQTDMIITLSIDGKPIVSYTSLEALTEGAPEGAVLLVPMNVYPTDYSSEGSLNGFFGSYSDTDYSSYRMMPGALFVDGLYQYRNSVRVEEPLEFYQYPSTIGGHKILYNDFLYSGALQEHTSGDFKYVMLSENTVAIIKYLSETSKVVRVPAMLDGCTVTMLGSPSENWQRCIDSDSVEQIELPDTLTALGFCAINCSNLKELTLPDSIEFLG